MNIFLKSILKLLGAIIGILLICVALMIGFLSLTEYKPNAEDPVVIVGQSERFVRPGDTLKVISWNIGYGALGDNADFFMDGGTSVNTASEERVYQNMKQITDHLKKENPDLILLQEADVSSTRSHRIDETMLVSSECEKKGDYQTTFVNNFKVAFLPYPIPPIGKVDSGLFTMSRFPVETALRIQLPIPFSWPVRMANLKRCLSVMRIPVENSDKELVVVNLHLEAFDSGEGKIAQTKMLKDFLETEQEKGNYVIAAGDFNQTFSSIDSSAYPLQEGLWHCGAIDVSEFDSSLTFLMDSRIPTCRSLDQSYADYSGNLSDFQYYVIDGMIVSDNIKVKTFETQDLNFVASDHNPVIAELELIRE